MKKVFMSCIVCFLMISFCSSVFAGDIQMVRCTWSLKVRDAKTKKWETVEIPVKFYYEIDYHKREINGVLNLPELHADYPSAFKESEFFRGPYTGGKTVIEWWSSIHPNYEGYITAIIP